jgi:GDSL-like lipase/acylhydrolase family protein
VEVECAAVPAHTSEHGLIRYAADAADLEPDVVLVLHVANDVYASAVSRGSPGRDYGTYPGAGPQLLARRERTGLVRFASFFFRRVLFSDFRERPSRLESVAADPAPLVRNLRAILLVARGRGQRAILCTEPHRFAGEGRVAAGLEGDPPLPPSAWFAHAIGAFNEEVRRLAAGEGVPLLDLEREIPPERELFLDEVHVSPLGAVREAAAAARVIAAHESRRR